MTRLTVFFFFCSRPHTEILLKRSIRTKKFWAVSFMFSFSISRSERTIELCQKLRRKIPAPNKQHPRRWKRRPFNLTRMKISASTEISSVEDWECTYTHTKWSPPHDARFTIIFLSRERSDERRGGEDVRVLRVLFFLNLYQLSSLKPSERLKHKRVQSLGDILFSPSLNTLYHNPRATQLHSLLDI